MLGLCLGIVLLVFPPEPPGGQGSGVPSREPTERDGERFAADRARAELLREIFSRDRIELSALVRELDLRPQGWPSEGRDLGFGVVRHGYRAGRGRFGVELLAARDEAGERVLEASFWTGCPEAPFDSPTEADPPEEEFRLAVEPAWPGAYDPGTGDGRRPSFRAEWRDEQARAAVEGRKAQALGPTPMVDVPAELLPDFERLTSPSRDLTFGDTGGIAGMRLPGRIATDRLVRHGRFDLLRAVLRGWNPAGRVFAADALLATHEADAADLRAIYHLRDQEIHYSPGGCTTERRNVGDLLYERTGRRPSRPALLTLLGLARDHPLAPGARFSSIVLAGGARRGLAASPPSELIEMGFDWASGEYRVTVSDRRRDAGEPYRTGVVSREWFEKVLGAVLASGLERIRPLSGRDDVYGLDTQLAFAHGEFFWVNGIGDVGDGGSATEDFPPSPAELRIFSDVVRIVRDKAADVAVEPGCLLDSGFVAQVSGRTEARALLVALEHALRSPLAASVDLGQIDFRRTRDEYEVRLRWRDSNVLDWLTTSYFAVRVDRATWETSEGSRGRPRPTTEAERSRRRALLEENVDLQPRLRELIARGWIFGSDFDDEGDFVGRWPRWSAWNAWRAGVAWPRTGRPVSLLGR